MRDEGFAGKHSSFRVIAKSSALLFFLILVCSIIFIGCSRQSSQINQTSSEEITVAAAANLTDVFAEISRKFTARTGVRVVYSFGATADLEKQIENGAPFDVFASADVEHVVALDRLNLLTPNTQKIFARGRLVLWIPQGSSLRLNRLEDLAEVNVERVAIAKPDVAPYGRATVEALRALNLWTRIEPRVIYAQNVTQTKQYAATGNADVAFIPLSLVRQGEGQTIDVNEQLHQPIDQAIAIIKSSTKQEAAQKFLSFIFSPEGQAILERYGYRKSDE
ncbi:MAG: molybdate ABC transporter substrate-binding protein [Acidobacteria bacterium 13_1_20CM_3_53_8]|nr:MAG: molybdate ABC transporter substrate-binding protein [Acidobacteria bacterium 13_1_20CM_3_53_8]